MVAVLVDGFHILLPGGIPVQQQFSELCDSQSTVHIYLEYHSFCLLVGIGTPHTLSRKGVSPPQYQRGGGGGKHSPACEGVGSPNLDDQRESSALCLLCGVIHKLPALINNEQIEFTCDGVRRYKFFCMVFCCCLLYLGTLRFTSSHLLSKEFSKDSEPRFEPRTCLLMGRRANNSATPLPKLLRFNPAQILLPQSYASPQLLYASYIPLTVNLVHT